MKKSDFIKGVERLINPIDVGTLHFIQSFNEFIPKKIQKKMVDSSSDITPYMGFVVEPYSCFLFYEIDDFDRARKLLPKGFELVKAKIFENDEPKYYSILGCFNAHTSGFWGLRVEFYVIAKNIETGLLSWIIIDYDTNTITYDPKNGLRNPNADNSIMTIDYNGILYVDVVNKDGRKLIFSSDITEGEMLPLDRRLWIEGNLSVAYGGNKSDKNSQAFSLKFDTLEFQKALRVSNKSLLMQENTWYLGLIKDKPTEIVCFPYAQHFLSDSPGHSSQIKNEQQLNDAIRDLDFSSINSFDTKSIRTKLLFGGMISFLINITLVLILLLKR